MTLHIVLGDGYMPTKELTAHLQDIQKRATADDDGFWFMVAAKSEPTDTDRALVKWLTDPKNDVYWDAIGDEDSADKIYEDAQVFHKATRLAPTVVKLMDKAKEGGELDEDGEPIPSEDADLLALYFSDDEEAEEDRWLNDVISAVADAGYPVYALNDGMTLIEPPEDGEDGDEEAEEEAEETAPVSYTREQLTEMELDELKKIAVERGIEVAPRSRRPTYVDAILGEAEDEVAEVEIEEAPKPPRPVSVSAGTSTTTYGTSSNTINMTELSGPAMVIVVYNGTVTSRVVTASQAQALLSA